MRHVLNYETILQAALQKDPELAFRAFINDPLVTIEAEEARKLFKQMISNTVNYLPGWKIE
jgi:alpha-galactosidase/6-phospho-beta-glucosidase family protein